MAARRLAISSLLCTDDAPPPSVTSPSQPSPSSVHHHATVEARYFRERAHDSPTLTTEHVSNLSPASSSRDIVPLSLQPVHIRGHTPSPHPEDDPGPPSTEHWSTYNPLPSDTRPTFFSHGFDLPDYGGRLPPLQAESSPPPSSLRVSDFYHQHSYSPPSASYTLRPSSSRSAHSDSPSTSLSYGAMRIHPPQPQSPSHSPTSIYSVSIPNRQASASPVPSTRPVSTSPLNYYNPTSHPQTPYRSPELPYRQATHSPVQGRVSSGPSSPPLPFASSHHLSQRVSQPRSFPPHSPPSYEPAPAPRTTSAAALPNILNSMSPPPRHSGLGGLEALVQAATEERRRLSGELASADVARKGQSLQTSMSPVMERSSVHPEVGPERQFLQPVRSPHEYHPPLDLDVAVIAYDEPPLKKRRGSSATYDMPVMAESRQRSLAGAFSVSVSEVASPSGFQHRSEVVQALAPVSVTELSEGVQVPLISGPGHDLGGAFGGSEEPHVLSSIEASPPPAVAMDQTEHSVPHHGDHVPAEAGGQQERKEKRKRERPALKKKDKDRGKEKARTKSQDEHGMQEAPPQRQEKAEAREEDPHEWLLEHYAAASPPRGASVSSPVEYRKWALSHPLPPLASDTNGGIAPAEDLSAHNGHADSKKRKHARSRTRTPTPLAMLEQELDSPHNAEASSFGKKERRETSVSTELDIAAGAVPDKSKMDRDDLMDLDVEDELLSLLDDQPSHSRPKHTTSRSKHAHPSKGLPDAKYAASAVDVQRESMPPPASTNVGTSKDGTSSGSSKVKGSAAVGVASHHKKDTTEKAMPKPKQPTKPKAKPAAKSKAKASGSKDVAVSAATPAAASAAVASLTPTTTPAVKSKKAMPLPASSPTKRSVSAAAGTSRSRSTSVMPGGSVGPDGKGQAGDAEEDEGGDTDDKLYCVCKTSYDEDRVMIACDRCDEWYHTQCVNMPDVEVDLVDQFICPPCIENNPHLSLRTTYKRRCLFGRKHPDPSSPSACHKPARGAFSKYCSDECGTLYMQSRIDAWGGDKRRLWEGVKNADKREGVTVRVKEEKDEKGHADASKVNGTSRPPIERSSDLPVETVTPSKTKVERDIARMHAQLERVAQRRDELKRDMEVVLWREKLVEYATARAETLNECGWDQRLCFGDEEYAEFGAGVLESYEELDQQENKLDRDHMEVDGAPEEGEWWCKGKKKCDRHAGWQKLRAAEISFEKETMEAALLTLTTQEREIRRQIEDVIDPQAKTSSVGTNPPLQPLNGKASSNGHADAAPNGDDVKKGKKRKN